MRNLLLTTCLLAPSLGVAQSLCGLPAPPEASQAHSPPSINLSPAVRAVMPSLIPSRPLSAASSVSRANTSPADEPAEAPRSVAVTPVLQHIVGAGARVEELGERGGLRSAVARTRDEFMLLSVTPDGQAAVGGLMAELSLEQLRSIAGSGLTELGERHGLRGVLVRSGTQFQVFYAAPDGSRVIPGVMWDASGRNLTREQVSAVQGALPTVTIGDVSGGTPAPQATSSGRQRAGAASTPEPRTGVAAAAHAFAGTVGRPDAPELHMFIDPLCAYSVQAMQHLQPLVARGQLRVSVIPLSVLDAGNGGASTRASLAMLSRPAEQMVDAWSRRDLSGPPAPEAASRLQINMQAAREIGLRGTPTFLWSRAVGGDGRLEGLPGDVAALVAAVRGR